MFNIFILTYIEEVNFSWGLALWVPFSDQYVPVLPISLVRGLISLSLAKVYIYVTPKDCL